MTNDSVMKMEMGKKFKVALTIPLVDIMKLSLSPDAGNQVVIIQLRGKVKTLHTVSFHRSRELHIFAILMLHSNFRLE